MILFMEVKTLRGGIGGGCSRDIERGRELCLREKEREREQA